MNMIFHPKPPPTRYTQDAPTAYGTIFFRVLDSLPSDSRQAVSHLSRHLRYLGHLVRVLSDTIFSGLDWSVIYTLSGNIGLAFHLVNVIVGSSISRIWSLFDKAQALKHLVDFFGPKYCPLLARVLHEVARQTGDLAVEIGCGLYGFLLDVAE